MYDYSQLHECDEIENISDLSGNIIQYYYTPHTTAQWELGSSVRIKVGE